MEILQTSWKNYVINRIHLYACRPISSTTLEIVYKSHDLFLGIVELVFSVLLIFL